MQLRSSRPNGMQPIATNINDWRRHQRQETGMKKVGWQTKLELPVLRK
jgi:hypothetical protein